MTASDLHPIIRDAATGRLPEWAAVTPERRRHLEQVAGLLETWAAELALEPDVRARWAAAGWLHDALRDADPRLLASAAPEYPEKVRHGPAVAARLRELGVDDEELLEAIAFHTLGRPGLGTLGRFLFVADYLEPGRDFEEDERARLRQRMPSAAASVLREVCARRIAQRLRDGKPLRRETMDFWNELVAKR
jgi:HD superfamily phosphohydrolase YqeK